MESFYPDENLDMVFRLQKLFIKDCPDLKFICGSMMTKMYFPHLKEVEVKNCPEWYCSTWSSAHQQGSVEVVEFIKHPCRIL